MEWLNHTILYVHLLKLIFNFCWDSSVSIALGYGLDNWGSIPSRAEKFSLHHCVQTGSGTHPASYPMDIRGKVTRE
jgi:hypothetical protein